MFTASVILSSPPTERLRKSLYLLVAEYTGSHGLGHIPARELRLIIQLRSNVREKRSTKMGVK